MSKRQRDFDAHLESYMKNPREQIQYVNPFEVMMAAARSQAQKQAQASGSPSNVQVSATPVQNLQQAAVQLFGTVPCTHCGQQLADTQVQQCSSCQDVFCSTCSLVNYEERDVRVFCLDCNSYGKAGGATSAGRGCWAVPAQPQASMMAAHMAQGGAGVSIMGACASPLAGHAGVLCGTPYQGPGCTPGGGGQAALLLASSSFMQGAAHALQASPFPRPLHTPFAGVAAGTPHGR
mmetsp:Transcript_31424/g.69988  ORF Transcript_31424/g.69988 Transcript_31424/m.69988 type:complete len:235 (+) Transcript_31424:116-820(+)